MSARHTHFNNPLASFTEFPFSLPVRGLRRFSVTLVLVCLASYPQFISSATQSVSHGSSTTKPTFFDFTSSRASVWGIVESDWDRYYTLMKGEAGLHFAHLEPAHVLGIYAESEADKARFATIVQQREDARVDKLFSFNRAYIKAKLKQRSAPIDERLIMEYKKLTGLIDPFERSEFLNKLSSQQRYVIAVTLNCTECDKSVRQFVERKLPIDIYVVDADDQEIKAWAGRLNIPHDRVRSGSITLNRDDAMRFSNNSRFPVMYEADL